MKLYDENNIFAKIIRKEIPAKIIYEDDTVIAIHDIAPAAPIHILVLTKKPYLSFNDFILKSDKSEIHEFFTIVQKIASDLGLESAGYRILMNHGEDAMQSVPHFHIHILGGKKLGRLIGN